MMRRIFVSAVVSTTLVLLAVPATAASVPDGRIVFADRDTGIWAIAPDGTSRIHLVADGVLPRWAPDGSGIAFAVSGGQGIHRIDLVDDDGGGRTKLIGRAELPDRFSIGWFAWSPDGTRFVLELYRRTDDDEVTRLVVTPIDGSSMTRIGRDAFFPDWSSTDRIVAGFGGDLIVMDADGGNRTTIVDRGRNIIPRWSSDGSMIAFERYVKRPGPGGALTDIFVAEADGSGVTNLTRTPHVLDTLSSWSPSGRHIVWSRPAAGDPFGPADLWRMRASGAGKTQLTSTRRIDEFWPDWGDAPN